jgi:hypothetical protein
MSPQAETKYTSLYRKCLINRGHSVLNWWVLYQK